jgi:glycosyltransferase involved in cell wall biosynthesis
MNLSDESPSIFHIDTEKGWGGGQNQVFLLITELLHRGYRNFLATPQDGELWNSLSPIAESNPEKLIFIPVRQRNQIDFSGIFRIQRCLRKQQAGIIHLHSWRGNLLGALASRLSGFPLVTTRRINYPLGSFSTFFVNRSKKACLVAISESVKQSLVTSGVTKDVEIIRDGVNMKSFIKENFGRLEKRPGQKREILIGHIGSFNRIKGQKYLVEIISHLVSEKVPVRLLFAGEGKELPAVKKLAEMKGLLDHVTFLGKVDPIVDFFYSLDIVAVTSTVEGLGVSTIEAMAAGLPVVSFRTGGLPEVILDGVTGLLVPPGDLRAFSEALLRLIHDQDLRLRLGQEGRKRGEDYFSHMIMVDSYVKLYRRALERLE